MKPNYSSEFGKTLSSGISALVKGKQQYYILEHLVGSHYHSAGEKQEIMLDEIILGRETDCHVRFDENFTTVSRHQTKESDIYYVSRVSESSNLYPKQQVFF